MMVFSSIFLWLINSAILSSITVLIILVIKGCLKNKLHDKWNYNIWFFMIVRLVIPDFWINNLHINLLPGFGEKVNAFIKSENNITIRNGLSHFGISNLTKDYAISVSDSNWIIKLLLCFWLLGSIISLTSMIVQTRKIKLLIQNASIISDIDVIEHFKEVKEIMNVKKKIRLLQSEKINSPVFCGIFKPSIILPKDIQYCLSQQELRYILIHELIHYKRRDIYINHGIRIFQILHWYNPILQYGFYCMRHDQEIACDTEVLKKLKQNEYLNYANTIISILKSKGNSVYSFEVAGFMSEFKHLRNRVYKISEYNKDKAYKKITIVCVCFLLSLVVFINPTIKANAHTKVELPKDAKLVDYDQEFVGFKGSFVLLELNENQYYIYNKEKSIEQVSPCSTFKIILSAIGLENHIINLDTVIPWDGEIYPYPEWNQDQTLESAFKYSTDWYYNILAKGIGEATISEYLRENPYGNNDISGGEYFWQESSLKISPFEQVLLLEKLYQNRLPFTTNHIDVIKQIMKSEDEGDTILYGKTGTGIINERSRNGWYVGYVENRADVYIFALNIQGNDQADGTHARNIALSILKKRQIIA